MLVTGGAGYIGSELVDLLAGKNRRVRVLDNFSMCSPRNLMGSEASIDLYIGDIRSEEDVRTAMDGVDAVVHLAARTGAQSSDQAREEFFDLNVGGTENVVEEARREGVDKFVFASSCNLYGYGSNLTETDDVEPPNAYAETKLEGERIVSTLKENGTSVHSLRMATNYGYSPGVRFNLAVNLFAHRAAYGEPVTIYGDGTNWRPFVHVKDSARAFAHAATSDDFPELVNVGTTDQNYTIAEVGGIVERVADTEIDVLYLEDKNPGPDYHVNFDRIERSRFTFEHDLEAGVDDMMDRFNAAKEIEMEVQ